MASRAELVVALKAVNEATMVLKEVQGDIKGMGDVAKGTTGPLGKMGSALGDVSKIAGGFILANGIMKAPDYIGSFVGAASDLNETLSKSDTIFKDNAKEIEDWASGAARDFGMSKQEALEAAGTLGNLFTQLDIGTEPAAEMSQAITELAADFASFHNADISSVIDAQTAAFRGEYDALQRYVPTINAAAVQQEALAMTGKKTTGELTEQDKALAVHSLMLKGAGEAAGDFDRTSQGLANQQRILSAEIDNAKAQIGTALLPVMTEMALFVTGTVIPAIRDFAEVAGPKVEEFATAVGKAWKEDIKPALDNLQAAWESIDQVVIPILQDLAADVQFMAETIALALGIVVDILGGDFSGAWDKVKQLVDGVVDAMERKITLFKDALKGLAPLVKEGALAIGGAIKDGIVEGLEAAGGLVADVHNALAALLEGAVNYVIDQVNDAVSFTIKNPLGPDVTVNPPDIPRVSLPRMAQGGVVVAGDNPSGIEAIVPLERAREFGFGGGAPVNIYLSAWDAHSVEEWLTREGASLIRTALEREVRFAA